MYIIVTDECYNFENATTIRLTNTYEKAQAIFEEEKSKYEEFMNDYDTIESGEKYISMLNYGDYAREHIDIYITEKMVE